MKSHSNDPVFANRIREIYWNSRNLLEFSWIENAEPRNSGNQKGLLQKVWMSGGGIGLGEVRRGEEEDKEQKKEGEEE